MRTVPIIDIAKLEHGEVIPSVRGTFKRVFDRKSGVNAKGDWSVQHVVLAQDGAEIKMAFWNHEDLKGDEGKEMEIRAHEGKKGLTSVFVEDEEYPKGSKKITRIIRVTEAAQIREADKQAAIKPAQETHVEPDPVEVDPAIATRRAAMQAANGFTIAISAMRYIADRYEKEHLGEELTSDHKQAICSSIFIFMDRHGLIQKLPHKPLEKVKPESKLPSKNDEGEKDW
jgi:hypothetical protein